jgi:hypothetical protein
MEMLQATKSLSLQLMEQEVEGALCLETSRVEFGGLEYLEAETGGGSEEALVWFFTYVFVVIAQVYVCKIDDYLMREIRES